MPIYQLGIRFLMSQANDLDFRLMPEEDDLADVLKRCDPDSNPRDYVVSVKRPWNADDSSDGAFTHLVTICGKTFGVFKSKDQEDADEDDPYYHLPCLPEYIDMSAGRTVYDPCAVAAFITLTSPLSRVGELTAEETHSS